jgi:hypothetical protein
MNEKRKGLLEEAWAAMEPLTHEERKQLSRYLRMIGGDDLDRSCNHDAALDALDKLTPEQFEAFELYVRFMYYF